MSKSIKFIQVVVAILVTAGVGWGVYFGYNKVVGPTAAQSTLPSNVQLTTARLGNITNSVTAGGNLVYANKSDLTFGSAGTVGSVNVQVGDAVKKGQTLAALGSASLLPLQQAVTQAQISLQNAKDNLTTVQNPDTTLVLAQANAAVANARVALETAQTNLTNAQTPYNSGNIAQAGIAVQKAEDTLSTDQTNLQTAQDNYTNAVDTYKSIVSFYYDISVTDAQVSQDPSWITSQPLAPNLPQMPPTYSTDGKGKVVVFPAPADAVTNAWNTAMQASSALNTAQQQVTVDQTTLENAQQSLTNTQAGADPLKVDQAQKQVDLAQANLNNALQALAQTATGPDPLQVTSAQNAVDSAQAALDTANQNLAAAVMTAPSDGLVSVVNIVAGQNIGATATAIEVIDPSVLQMSATVGEFDIPSIKVGQRVTLSVDALPNVSVSGQLTYVSPIGKSTQGVVSYPVTIQVTQPQGAKLQEGMSATAEIITQEANNVLIVPNSAIHGTTNNPTVTVLVNGQSEVKQVKTGATDGTYTEITQGLQQGDQVEITTTTSSSSSTSTGTRIPGVGGGGFLGGGNTIIGGG